MTSTLFPQHVVLLAVGKFPMHMLITITKPRWCENKLISFVMHQEAQGM